MIATVTRMTRSFLEDHVTWRLPKIDNLTQYLKFLVRLVVVARNPFVIGVTGSVGKSTKAMIGAVLSHPDARRSVGIIGTARNMNDSLGMPLIILGFDSCLKGDSISKLKLPTSMPLRALKIVLSKDYPRIKYGTSGIGDRASWSTSQHRTSRS